MAARALRDRVRVYALAAEFNAERDLRAFEACDAALRERFGDAERVGRLAIAASCTGCRSASVRSTTVWVDGPNGPVDAREVSDVIAKLSGKAYWRKLFVRTRRRQRGATVAELASSRARMT